ncbi:hypothetical protein J0H58_01565 [bacterium]|nr:hypothetical protein [bacterium]
MRLTRPLVLAALAAVVGSNTAEAHDLKAVVTVTATEVKVEAGYDDDTPADGGKVRLTTADGNAVADGKLDERGCWATKVPPPGSYVVVVNDIGHRDRVAFTIPAPPAAEAVAGPPLSETTYSNWRLDKTLGTAIGLTVLLGGSLLYAVLRRKPVPPSA